MGRGLLRASMTTGGSERNSQTLAQVEQAYSEWGGCLLRFATRLCDSREDAEDIVIETFIHAYRNWDTFREMGSRKSWLYGIAVNRHRMHRRKRRLNVERLHEDMPAKGADILDQIALDRALGKLPASQREAFLLVKSEGLTAREAGEVLGRPLGTILYEVHQAVHFIRAALEGNECEQKARTRLCGVEP
jgi:RNA polymerase sigma-70 factor (ECF subfamily)